MFTAVVFACLVAQPDMCLKATDSRGPYSTKPECTARVEEMIEAMIYILPPVPHMYRHTCIMEGLGT